MVRTQEGRNDIYRELDRLERGTYASSSTKLSVKIVYMGQGNPKHKYSLGGELTERSPERNELGLLVGFVRPER